MFRKLNLVVASLMLIAACNGLAQADPLIVVTYPDNNTTAATLAAQLVSPLGGITINSATYAGATTASGSFTGGTGVIGFESGIVLTSANADFVIGPNNAGDAGGDNGAPGTALIDNSNNASVLTIQFTPTASQVFFNYVFGSEEYNEFVNTEFNDAFRFLVNGTNFALIPGTSTAVEINTVNNGSNSSFFVDNTAGGRNTQLDGLTTVLGFSAPVNAGVVNTLQLVIADRGDAILGSAVFIQGGTFQVTPPTQTNPVPEPATMLLLGTGLVGVAAAAARKRRKLNNSDEA